MPIVCAQRLPDMVPTYGVDTRVAENLIASLDVLLANSAAARAGLTTASAPRGGDAMDVLGGRHGSWWRVAVPTAPQRRAAPRVRRWQARRGPLASAARRSAAPSTHWKYSGSRAYGQAVHRASRRRTRAAIAAAWHTWRVTGAGIERARQIHAFELELRYGRRLGDWQW
jgi:hypothetical protein